MDGQCENSIPTTNKVCGGIIKVSYKQIYLLLFKKSYIHKIAYFKFEKNQVHDNYFDKVIKPKLNYNIHLLVCVTSLWV